MSFARFSTNDLRRQDPRLRRRGRVHRRSARHLRRRRRGARFRSCRTCCATSARTASSITWRRTCRTVARRVHEATTVPGLERRYHESGVASRDRSATSSLCSQGELVHEHRCRSRFRHAERARFHFRQRTGRLGVGRRRSIRCTARRTIPTTPRRATPTTWARWSRRCASALGNAGVDGDDIEAIALDTTGSSVIPVDEHLQPLDDYYLWCDHRAWQEAARDHRRRRTHGRSKPSTGAAASTPPSGASPSCCTGCATIRTSARASPPRWSTATWWPPCCAASPIRRRCRAASAPWATSGCGTQRWAVCRRKSS